MKIANTTEDASFNEGYSKAIQDIIDVIHKDHWASVISVYDVTLADHLTQRINAMLEEKP